MAKFLPDGVKMYEADLDAVVNFMQGNSILDGAAVTAQASPNMSVKSSAGTLRYGGAVVTVAAVDPIAVSAADPANPRVDLVEADGVTGAVTIKTGTPAATPKPPTLTAGRLLLAYISVGISAANIQSSNLSERRIQGPDAVLAGTLAARPTAAVAGVSFYFATDTNGGTIYRSNGTTWAQAAAGATEAAVTMPNLVLNSDFARRTVLGLAMPEAFADLSGTTKIDGGAAGSVASNIFTQGAANNEYAWCAGAFVWRDGRMSASYKAGPSGQAFELRWRISADDWISAWQDNSVSLLKIRKRIAGVTTDVASIATTGVADRWQWLEIEKQGTTIIASVYSTGGTTPGVTKAASTLIATVSGTVSDASVQVGAHPSITSDHATGKWGGIATGNGGVYVETWLPESHPVTFGGTLGGQAIGYDESADSGPVGKQNALRTYTPAASRTMTIQQWDSGGGAATTVGRISPSTAYAGSVYLKTSGFGGSGNLIDVSFYDYNLSGADVHTLANGFANATESTWTRKTATAVSASTGRQYRYVVLVNPGSTATGTAYFMLPQLEQGSAATAWRNAPADDGPINVEVVYLTPVALSTAASSNVEMHSRDLAVNLNLPWDATVVVEAVSTISLNAAGTAYLGMYADGVFGYAGNGRQTVVAGDTVFHPVLWKKRYTLSAGKHRLALGWFVLSGATTVNTSSTGDAPAPTMLVTATRGK